MKLISAILLVFIVLSCENANNKKLLQTKKIVTDNVDNKETEGKQLDYTFDAMAYIVEYKETSQNCYLDSAFLCYEKVSNESPRDVLPIIYCGMIKEKLGKKRDAIFYYQQAMQQAKKNSSEPKIMMQLEFGKDNSREIAELYNVSEREITDYINEQQKFYLIYVKILLQENTKEELTQFKQIALKSENPSFKQLKDVNSNIDLLKQLEGE